MPWILLIIAGLLEAAWALGLKCSDGFTRPVPSVLTAVGIVASMALLSVATRSLPIGAAYPAWVGIGAAGAVLLGALFFGETLSPPRVFFLALLIVAIIGLKATSP